MPQKFIMEFTEQWSEQQDREHTALLSTTIPKLNVNPSEIWGRGSIPPTSYSDEKWERMLELFISKDTLDSRTRSHSVPQRKSLDQGVTWRRPKVHLGRIGTIAAKMETLKNLDRSQVKDPEVISKKSRPESTLEMGWRRSRRISSISGLSTEEASKHTSSFNDSRFSGLISGSMSSLEQVGLAKPDFVERSRRVTSGSPEPPISSGLMGTRDKPMQSWTISGDRVISSSCYDCLTSIPSRCLSRARSLIGDQGRSGSPPISPSPSGLPQSQTSRRFYEGSPRLSPFLWEQTGKKSTRS